MYIQQQVDLTPSHFLWIAVTPLPIYPFFVSSPVAFGGRISISAGWLAHN